MCVVDLINKPKCDCRAYQSVLGVDGSKGTMLAQMGGVAQHGRITRLNHRPGRAPWVGGRVEAFCQGTSSRVRGGEARRARENQPQEIKRTMKATYETCHITVITSFNRDAPFNTPAPQGVY